MDRRIALAALPVLALVLAPSPRPAAAEETKVKLPWDGFGVGSFVHQKSTSTTTGPGMENVPPQVTEMKQTLVKVTDDAYTVKNETKMGEEWQGMEIPFPRKGTGAEQDTKGPKPEDLGEEKVSVDGTDITCKKTRLVADGATTTSWTHEKHG